MSARSALLAATLVIAAGALAGCGSSGSSATGEKPGDGKQIFVDSCGGCHTFKAAGTTGGSGPDLTNLKVGAEAVATQVKNGGGGMPAFSGELSPQQIDAVSSFVAANDGSSGS